MRITAVETIRPELQPNLLFVQLHTDDGRCGLGEAFFGSRTVEAYLHESVAGVLFGMSDPTPEAAARALASYTGYAGGGAETRGNGAIDLALWDLVGQEAGLPLVRLFGGPVHESLPTYNTCAGPGYISTSTQQRSDNWGVPTGRAQRYDDLDAFLHRPAALARDLWDEGIRGMKVWPFDQAAERTGGTDLSPAELSRGLAVIEAIRTEVGFDMALMVELHGLWNRRGATTILQALTEYRPYWVEDPIRPDAVDALAALSADTDVPIATGETVVGRRGFLPLLQRDAVDVVTMDVQWTGGLTEARKIAALADTFGVPVAPHDCTGPATLAACVHLTQSVPNGLIQETVRAFLRTWYAELVEGLPEIVDGRVTATPVPGHGVRLRDGLAESDQVERRVSTP
ncbi:L-alanine-DL-glutamate epimerase-like enolase superfamily enzyme [Kribbella amoyensis]|uniref:L-alanine-DL-glutamate epimerase-like enolase superfamily enzyme n=1 Tax=Kribbella amoyensis TaxID=996641 RepID=A0A561BVZ1_9ACTN|nr:mandelate racemase/muconate lactonizing enzyme family protein [Kribbella amoyensis]TWD83060.1 L-alanine-DL-glutamate epimerase-like enolase superfamily enzyme [Kribbella amoyensis]